MIELYNVQAHHLQGRPPSWLGKLRLLPFQSDILLVLSGQSAGIDLSLYHLPLRRENLAYFPSLWMLEE